uniref:Uncharacterized protein n=1 Tax=Heterorhabditis bacteriophora TaxID=37862 RepID=A0A1I7XTD5_HETBA
MDENVSESSFLHESRRPKTPWSMANSAKLREVVLGIQEWNPDGCWRTRRDSTELENGIPCDLLIT